MFIFHPLPVIIFVQSCFYCSLFNGICFVRCDWNSQHCVVLNGATYLWVLTHVIYHTFLSTNKWYIYMWMYFSTSWCSLKNVELFILICYWETKCSGECHKHSTIATAVRIVFFGERKVDSIKFSFFRFDQLKLFSRGKKASSSQMKTPDCYKLGFKKWKLYLGNKKSQNLRFLRK